MECTLSSCLPWWVVFVLHCDGEMAIWKWTNNNPSVTTSARTAVVTHQLLRELKVEALDVGKGAWVTEVLHENKSIRHSYIKQEGVDVFVKFPALCSAAIIATELVSTIHMNANVCGQLCECLDGPRSCPGHVIQLPTRWSGNHPQNAARWVSDTSVLSREYHQLQRAHGRGGGRSWAC